MLRQVFIFIFFVTLFILFDESASALNLFSNPGFEDGISSWTLNGTTATFSAVTEQKRSGSYAAKLSKENSSSWAYFYQRVPIETGKYYKLSGWLRLNDGSINNGKLRFYWLSDSNGTKVVPDPVEVELTSKSSDFQFIQTDSVISPDQSVFAEAQGYVYLNQENPVVPLLFDDLVFENSQPTPMPTTTPKPTQTLTPTPTSPAPTKTPTPSPSKIPSPTQKPTPTLFLLEDKEKLTIDEAFPTSVLGESMESETIDKDKPLKKIPLKEAKVLGVQTDNLSKILISIGVILFLACGILFFRTYMLNKKNGE